MKFRMGLSASSSLPSCAAALKTGEITADISVRSNQRRNCPVCGRLEYDLPAYKLQFHLPELSEPQQILSFADEAEGRKHFQTDDPEGRSSFPSFSKSFSAVLADRRYDASQ
ncbi:MAG TPA: hypothetical protein VNQ79_23095 [Blastocatellia bacterium]|nr:hypothetical protein [Blastocatellia bacterium]